jgi:uncharacterized protein (TIGR03000 family)
MYHKAINLGGILILAGTAFFWTTAPGQAAGHGGGGHGGGGHGGGGHGGFGGHGGGGHGGFGGHVGHSGFGGHVGHSGFSGHSGFHGAPIGHFHGVGRAGHDFGRGRHDFGRDRHDFGRDRHDFGRDRHDFGRGGHNRGWFFGSYYPGLYGYGGYPYYGSSLYPDAGYYGPWSYTDYGYDGSSYGPAYDTFSSNTDYDSGPMYQDGGYATALSSDNIAHLTVRVPPGAQVWFENQTTNQKGAVRNFVSPALAPGRDYTYDIRATWLQSGRTVDQKREVAVHAGSRVTVDFTQPVAGQP